MSDIAIKVEDVGKLYRLGQIGTGTLSHDLNRWWANVRGKEDPFAKVGETNDRTSKGQSDYVWALKGVNFDVKQGEVLGILGRNGAGKSTLLKILSKVTTPSTGKIKVQGRIASLLEVGTGFHPELTGRENVFLNGAILGMTKAEIKKKLDEIINFSGVQRYIDTPVKRYSSGMYVRLAFAVAAFLEPEILIIDEVLAVGDAEFQKKCLGRMKDVSVNDGRTVLFVSHDLNSISQLCNRVLLFENGVNIDSGNVGYIINKYLSKDTELPYYKRQSKVKKEIYIEEIKVCDERGTVCKDFFYYQPVHIDFTLQLASDHKSIYSFFVMILDIKKRRVFACETEKLSSSMRLTIEPNLLVRGTYTIHCFINRPKVAQLDIAEDVCPFQIIDNGSIMAKHGDYDYGVVFGKYSWKNMES